LFFKDLARKEVEEAFEFPKPVYFKNNMLSYKTLSYGDLLKIALDNFPPSW
jgi:hypothetical protein